MGQLYLFFKIRFQIVFTLIVMAMCGSLLHGCSSYDVDDSVVMVAGSINSFGNNLYPLGSGFVVADGGYIITNYHVISSAIHRKYRRLFVLTEGKRTKYYSANIVDYSQALDLAILRVPELKAPPLSINTGEIKKLDAVRTIGFPAAAQVLSPNGLSATISSHAKGEVSRIFDTYQTSHGTHVRAVQHNALVNKGNSGGPLINDCGEIIGVNVSYARGGQGIFFSIHSSELIRFLRSRNIPAHTTGNRCGPGGGNSTTFWLIILSLVFSLIVIFGLLLVFWPGARRVIFGGGSTSERDEGEYRDIFQSSETEMIGNRNAREVYQLRSVDGYEVFRLDPDMIAQAPLVIGRTAGGNGIEIDKPDISRQHARVTVCVYDPYKLCLEDLRSRNGTRVNGTPLSPGGAPSILQVGDNIQIGNQNYIFSRFTGQSTGIETAIVQPEMRGWVLRGNDRTTGTPISIDVNLDDMRLRNNQLVIGRNRDHCDVVIADPTVSSKGHAKIVYQNNEYRISDMGSTNGTCVDQEKLEPGVNVAVLRDNMVLQLGSVELRVERRQG